MLYIIAIVATVFVVFVGKIAHRQYLLSTTDFSQQYKFMWTYMNLMLRKGEAVVTDYTVCSTAERICKAYGTTVTQQPELLRVMDFYLFKDGRGGSNCTHREAQELIASKLANPVVRDFSLAMTSGIRFYLDNIIQAIVTQNIRCSTRQLMAITAINLGHERQHSQQSWEFINAGRPHPIMQVILYNPITVLLTCGLSTCIYNNIPSEKEANDAGFAFSKRCCS